jgi:hypothetical protein
MLIMFFFDKILLWAFILLFFTSKLKKGKDKKDFHSPSFPIPLTSFQVIFLLE